MEPHFCTAGRRWLNMFMKYCNAPGCNQLIPHGAVYCKRHTIDRTADTAEQRRTYDAHHRNRKSKAFYNSMEWHIVRRQALTRDAGIDIYLYMKESRVVPADTVHHIVELAEDYTQRSSLDNLISVSEATHSMISKAYKDENKKETMQKTLRECLKQYLERTR
jgi:hypothetical protein